MPATATAFGSLAGSPFPNELIRIGSDNVDAVRQIQARLNEIGCGPVPVDGVFDSTVARAVKLFQARFPDANGLPLVADGKVGSLTWEAMFGSATMPSTTAAPSALTGAAIAFATTQIGVREDPLGSNRGPQVDRYLEAAGLDPSAGDFPWCVAFTHFCYRTAAAQLGIPNPHIRTAGVLDHWNKAGAKANVTRVVTAKAVANPGSVTPGALFIMDFGGAAGHSGMVIEVAGGKLVTSEGNTNDNGSRNGIGVFRRTARKIADINKGFVDYSAF